MEGFSNVCSVILDSRPRFRGDDNPSLGMTPSGWLTFTGALMERNVRPKPIRLYECLRAEESSVIAMKKMAIDYKSHFATDTFTLVAKIPPKEIGYVNSIIESYEGIGVLRTRDGKEGIVEFWVVPFFEKEFMELIEALKTEIPLTILS